MRRTIEELTDSESSGADGVGPWIPQDVYADLILEGIVCYGQLSGVITAMEYDFTRGGGDTIQVRYISPRTTSCLSHGSADESECLCVSATSTGFGTYSIPVQAWPARDDLCGYSEWEADGPVRAMIMNEMAKRMAECRDERIWGCIANDLLAVTGSSAGYVLQSLVSCGNAQMETSCCTFTFALYNSVVTIMKHMQSRAYEPDYVIMNPNVAKFLYFKEGGGFPYQALPGTSFDEKTGKLLTIAGLKVIESCNATECNLNGKDKLAYCMAAVIDSKRAVGEVWGKKPTFTVEYVPECDTYKLVLWQYWGANTMDLNAIGHLVNPL